MGQYDELLSAIPVSQLAQQVGADEASVSQAVQQVLPALVGGLSANAQRPEGAASLTNALSDHAETDFGDLSNVNVDDGSKIVGHIFGDQQEAVVSQLGGLGGSGGGLIQKLLPILAPIVLGFLAKKMGGAGGLGGALTDALGGGGSTSASAAPAGGGVGDILGDLLGGALGGQAGGQAGGLGGLDDLLGGLLGGGKQ
ncbi:MAG: DUF937 domain-containing protein [Actinomycetales bacterium]|nr:DUF937 domain-containing protein [Actinomycetales bacterium]